VPLLKRGPEVSPPGLFDLSETIRPWVVAHTRSRQEKSLVRHLEPLGIPFYLPQREHRMRRAGRNFVSHLPIFPGYVFLRTAAEERADVFRSNVVVRLLDVRDQQLIGSELRQIRALQEAGASLVPYRSFVPGEPVKITDGPFRGHRGIVLREQSQFRLIVSISMLRQSVAVEFDRSCLSAESGDRAIEKRPAVA
jgi:transcription antitermination factor NusG